MKKILLLTVLFIYMNCLGQGVFPLDTNIMDIPKGSYMKDLNNELNPYVGIWKAKYNGREIKLFAKKEQKVPFLDYYFQDMIIVRYEVKDSKGKILESTIGKTLDNIYLMISGFSIEKSKQKLECVFAGGNCNLGHGFIYLKRQGNNQLLWSYYPQAILVTKENENKCSGEIYLPEGENIVFTRQ